MSNSQMPENISAATKLIFEKATEDAEVKLLVDKLLEAVRRDTTIKSVERSGEHYIAGGVLLTVGIQLDNEMSRALSGAGIKDVQDYAINFSLFDASRNGLIVAPGFSDAKLKNARDIILHSSMGITMASPELQIEIVIPVTQDGPGALKISSSVNRNIKYDQAMFEQQIGSIVRVIRERLLAALLIFIHSQPLMKMAKDEYEGVLQIDDMNIKDSTSLKFDNASGETSEILNHSITDHSDIDDLAYKYAFNILVYS